MCTSLESDVMIVLLGRGEEVMIKLHSQYLTKLEKQLQLPFKYLTCNCPVMILTEQQTLSGRYAKQTAGADPHRLHLCSGRQSSKIVPEDYLSIFEFFVV